MKQARISRGGQVSIPAAVRHRWKGDRILVEDLGDALVLRPLPDDPIAGARGFLKPYAGEKAISSDEARRRTRAEEAAAPRRQIR
jgi:bifunctional DNA-binding transcriptional regulator/antitoxin component of YhaV-PrlF toxin-antitoxin module